MNAGFKIPSAVDAEPADRAFDLRFYLNFVWRNWMFIASVMALALLVAVISLVRATPLYTATTQVLIDRRESPPVLAAGDNDRYYSYSSLSAYLDNQLAILRSDSLLRRVVIKERLAAQSKDDPAATETAIADGINRLRGALTVSRRDAAQVLFISITWEDAVRAGQLANAVADAYVVDQLDARFESAKRASGWLSDRLVELRRQLRDSEESVTTFRKEHGLTRSGPTVALNEQQLADLNSKLIAARTDAAEKKARVDFLADLAAGKKTLSALPDSLLTTSTVYGCPTLEACRCLAARGRSVGAL